MGHVQMSFQTKTAPNWRQMCVCVCVVKTRDIMRVFVAVCVHECVRVCMRV